MLDHIYINIYIFMVVNTLYVISMYVYCRYTYVCCGMHMGQYSPISSGGESRHDIGSSHAGNYPIPTEMIASEAYWAYWSYLSKTSNLGSLVVISQAHDSIVINVVGS